MKTKVAVVIPNWNGKDYIGECLTSLESQTLRPAIIVVENGSTDGSAEFIKAKFPGVALLEFDNNAGFAGGVNRGIRKAIDDGFEYVVLFNNDAVADKNWMKNLVQAAIEKKDAGIITGKFMRSDKKYIDSTGDNISIWGSPFPRGRNQKDIGQFDKAEYVFGGTGGASLYRVKALKEIGLFDEKFFAYYEDVDISFRAQLAGWKVWYQPDAVAYHRVGATSSKLGDFSRYHATKNFFMLYAKNMPTKLYWKYKPLFVVQAVRLGVGSLLKGGFIAFMRGFIRACINIPRIYKDRKQIQKGRKVNSDYIDKMLYHGRPPKIPTI